MSEEDLAVLRDPFEKGHVGKRAFSHTCSQQTPEVVVVSRHTTLSRFVGRPEGFLVEQAGLFPKRTFGREDFDRDVWFNTERRKLLEDVRADDLWFGRPVVGSIFTRGGM